MRWPMTGRTALDSRRSDTAASIVDGTGWRLLLAMSERSRIWKGAGYGFK